MFLFLLLLLAPAAATAQTWAVRNNLLYDATTTPNLSLEYKTAPRWTLGATVGLNPFTLKNDDAENEQRKLRHILVMPQVRYWLCEAFEGHYLSANVAYAHYNVSDIHFPLGLFKGVRDQRRQGDLVALGASYGYAHALSTHWNLELEAGLDVGYAWSKVYKCRHCGRYLRDDNRPLLLPKLALNFAYVW